MKKARWISAAISTAVLTAGFVLPAGAAFADGPSGNGNAGVLSLLSGNNVNAPLSAPVDVCGVAVALLGGANAGCEGGAKLVVAAVYPCGALSWGKCAFLFVGCIQGNKRSRGGCRKDGAFGIEG